MNSAERWVVKADQGNDWLRMRGAPPIPNTTTENRSKGRTKVISGTGPYHVSSTSELDGFASPLAPNKRGHYINSERGDKSADLHDRFMKLMKRD